MGCIKKVVVVERLNVASVEDWTFSEKTLEIVRLDGRIASAPPILPALVELALHSSLSHAFGILLRIHLRVSLSIAMQTCLLGALEEQHANGSSCALVAALQWRQKAVSAG